VYRLVTAGDAGLNLSLTDLFGREVELPSLRSIVKTLITGKPIRIRIRESPAPIIRRLEVIQGRIDKRIEEEVDKAKRLIR
jgi:hypothetical protein